MALPQEKVSFPFSLGNNCHKLRCHTTELAHPVYLSMQYSTEHNVELRNDMLFQWLSVIYCNTSVRWCQASLLTALVACPVAANCIRFMAVAESVNKIKAPTFTVNAMAWMVGKRRFPYIKLRDGISNVRASTVFLHWQFNLPSPELRRPKPCLASARLTHNPNPMFWIFFVVSRCCYLLGPPVPCAWFTVQQQTAVRPEGQYKQPKTYNNNIIINNAFLGQQPHF